MNIDRARAMALRAHPLMHALDAPVHLLFRNRLGHSDQGTGLMAALIAVAVVAIFDAAKDDRGVTVYAFGHKLERTKIMPDPVGMHGRKASYPSLSGCD